MAHARPFAFEGGAVDYARDSSRFLQGTPPVPALYAAEAGYEIVHRVGVGAIRAKSERQVQLLLDLAAENGLLARTPSRASERGGMVVLDVPEAEAVTRELLRREILIDYRPGAGIRLSPHFYTTDEEVRGAVREIRSILDSGAFRTHLGAGGAGF
jgi:kynureninase